MNVAGCVWLPRTVICLSIQGGSVTGAGWQSASGLSAHTAVPQGNFTQCVPDRLARVLNSQERGRVNYPSATCPSSLVPTQCADEAGISSKQWLHLRLSLPDCKWHLSPNRGNCASIALQCVPTSTIFSWVKKQEENFPNSTKDISIWDIN